MKYVYPGIFTLLENDEYDVRIPDLPGCITCGESLAQAIEMASDAASMWLCDSEENNEEIPPPSSTADVKVSPGQFVSLILADTDDYRKRFHNKAVKKTLSIPSWLNSKAEKENINFSKVLQDALKEKLSIF